MTVYASTLTSGNSTLKGKWPHIYITSFYRTLPPDVSGGTSVDLIVYAHRKGWPLLGASVVNQKNPENGYMEPPTLKGFSEAARSLG